MMATELATSAPDPDAQMVDNADPQDAGAAEELAKAGRKRPRIDMATDSGQRKRGKSMFALALGTLTKAKNEDRERNQSEAAKKRQEIEQRLQEKLRKENDSVRRQEEVKKDKTAANRKEEELQLKDSIYKLRRARLPLLAHFLLTSDSILDVPPTDDSSPPPASSEAPLDGEHTNANLAAATAKASKAPALVGAPRSHPPPLYYLPAILTPSQETFLKRRKEEVKAAAEAEWSAFVAERTAGIAEIARLRERVAEEDTRVKASRTQEDVELPDAHNAESKQDKESRGVAAESESATKEGRDDMSMEVDDESAKQKREEKASAHADEDDAVEY